jgi:hypothetical protein
MRERVAHFRESGHSQREGEFSNVTDSYAGKGAVRYQW